ncbi:MAG TPA: thioredoxin family protein [Epsilonproteobacteria bacterium]|nr:thioredoxin family protein [Campylobacterota bacterium]HHD79750.1 thioredoxin family protein [Campylobacterota bacterium]
MIKIVMTLLMLTGTLLALDWVKDLDTALTKAQKEHRNIMVMVEGEHCRWCKKMKGRTLLDEDVEKRLEKFVVVKVMRENSTAMAKLPPVDGVPTIFFMKPNKAVIQEVLGYMNVEDFISYVNDVEKK